MIAINELSLSYMTEMEANEVDSIFGGLSNFLSSGTPNFGTLIGFTPLGGNDLETLEEALDYAGTGIVVEGSLGGNFSFLAIQLS